MPSKAELLQRLASTTASLYRAGGNIHMELFPGTGYHNLRNFRHLAHCGGQTVSNLARFHHVTRQRMAEIVGEWEEAGWVELVPNPRHKTARLVQLTETGQRLFMEANQQELAMLTAIQDEFNEIDIRTATAVVRRLQNAVHRYYRKTRKEPNV
jgi:DNA-binding MarR family transcriptional regulator